MELTEYVNCLRLDAGEVGAFVEYLARDRQTIFLTRDYICKVGHDCHPSVFTLIK